MYWLGKFDEGDETGVGVFYLVMQPSDQDGIVESRKRAATGTATTILRTPFASPEWRPPRRKRLPTRPATVVRHSRALKPVSPPRLT